MEQALLIVWRESVEALLVIGILYAWLRRQPGQQRALLHLWAGVGAGLLLAALLAALMALAGNWMSGPGGEWFQTGLSLLACVLILQMVHWMSRNGGQLRRQLEQRADSALQHGRLASLALLAALAVAREGSETVIFLYGVSASASPANLVLGAGLGLLLGLLCFGLLQAGSRFIAWRQFFLVSKVLLLLLGNALLMSAVDRASSQWMALELPELIYTVLSEPMWDSSALLDDGGKLGALLASLSGYRAMPSALHVILLAYYWLLAWSLLRRPRRILLSSAA
ncbi:FTR1 family iron permease [Pseudomonas cavernicola]|uniref:FTR1 family iron permease n=1 Tax=Pseudomonas cavernicola TaxID=2320866 RepID=A0A418X945_9PSED|nr:FTR1 family protein [Pseudomonas cavernicola]RJG08918.1 FTR1 family iron permease [Pseudomonas cavernicola]